MFFKGNEAKNKTIKKVLILVLFKNFKTMRIHFNSIRILIFKNVLFATLILLNVSCKEDKKEEPSKENIVNKTNDFFSSYRKVSLGKNLADKIIIDNLYIKTEENELDETTNYTIVFDFNEDQDLGVLSNYKLTVQLYPIEEEMNLLNDISVSRNITSEYYFINVGVLFNRTVGFELDRIFQVEDKDYISINFNTKLNNLEYLGILLRSNDNNKYLKKNIKIQDFKFR